MNSKLDGQQFRFIQNESRESLNDPSEVLLKLIVEMGTKYKKAGHDSDRQQISDLQQIINVGPSIADDLMQIGIKKPQQLVGGDPVELYQEICASSGVFNDPCVLDVMISCVDFMNGNPPQTWWSFTAMRKKKYSNEVEKLRVRHEG